MVYFVIGGKPDCPAFAHVYHVGSYLEEHLPNFNIRVIQKEGIEWQWIAKVNLENGWHHTCSPIIWKELSMRGGKPYLVGGISEFWEYCYDFYGLESILSSEHLKRLVKDNLQYLQEVVEKDETKRKIFKICVIGASNRMTIHLLPELLQLTPNQPNPTIINLYDDNLQDPEVHEFLENIAKDIDTISKNGNIEIVRVIDSLDLGIEDCDVAVIITDYTRRKLESEEAWLMRNVAAMNILTDVINAKAKRKLKVILAFHGPICFDASILVTTCTRIRINNIVAITSDVGLGPLNEMAKQINIPLQKIAGPPVWGFVGNYDFVDIECAIQCCDVYLPYRRILGNKGGSTLALGKVVRELRYLTYLRNQMKDVVLKSKQIQCVATEGLCGPPVLSKVRAVMSLLKLWFSKQPSDDIISLGVCSNGCFGYPAGVVFSQPVMLEDTIWRPFRDFPISAVALKANEDIILRSLELLHRFHSATYVIDGDASTDVL